MKGTLVLLCLVAVSSATWTTTTYTATANANQVVPNPGGINSYATVVAIFNRNVLPMTLDVEIQCNVLDMGAINIYYGPRGQNGPLLYQFDGPVTSNMRQIFEITNFVGTQNYTINGINITSLTTDEQEDAFLNGQFYIQVLSANFPLGDVRGQFESQDRIYARLSSENTIPIASASSASGILLGTIQEWPYYKLSIDVVHSSIFVQAAEVRNAPPGRNGPLLMTFQPGTSPLFEDFTLTINERKYLLDGSIYFQVRTVSNPDGDIRGQLFIIDQYPNIGFTARLEGNQVVPPTQSSAKGCALVSFDCDSQVVEYIVVHDVKNAVQATARGAPPGQNGPVQFNLPRAQSPIYGSKILSEVERYLLYDRELQFIIQSIDYPAGEIRGQVGTEYDYYAYMSGSHAVPPVTTSAVGCGVFKIVNTHTIDYFIVHSVASPIEVMMVKGAVGQNGDTTNPSVNFNKNFIGRPKQGLSPMIGSDIWDDDDYYNLVDEREYVVVLTNEHRTTGEIRGQVYRIDPCSVAPPYEAPDTSGSYSTGNQDNDSNTIRSSLFIILGSLSLFVLLTLF